jgi:hypothetical protein
MLQEVLTRKFREAIAQQEMQQRAQALQQQREAQQGQLGLGQQRIGLDREQLAQQGKQFDVTAGQRDRTINLDEQAQPIKLEQMRAQTGEIQRKPQAEEQDRAFTLEQLGLGHKYRSQEIAQQGANSLAVANTNHPAGGAPAANEYGAERETRMRDMVSQILPEVSRMTAGVGSLMKNIPESGARNLDALKSNIGFRELQEMRNASKTGGALGQVSDTENRLLSSALGSLDQGQSPDQLKAALNQIVGALDRWEAAKAKFGGAAPAAGAKPSAADLIKKYGG